MQDCEQLRRHTYLQVLDEFITTTTLCSVARRRILMQRQRRVPRQRWSRS